MTSSTYTTSLYKQGSHVLLAMLVCVILLILLQLFLLIWNGYEPHYDASPILMQHSPSSGIICHWNEAIHSASHISFHASLPSMWPLACLLILLPSLICSASDSHLGHKWRLISYDLIFYQRLQMWHLNNTLSDVQHQGPEIVMLIDIESKDLQHFLRKFVEYKPTTWPLHEIYT
jgi:hypothetical protein